MKDLQTVLDALEQEATDFINEYEAYEPPSHLSEAIAIVKKMMQAEPVAYAKSISDELMDCVDRLGSEYDQVDPRVWKHLLVYAPQAVPAGFVLVPVEPTEAMRNAAIIEQEHHRKVSLSLYGDGPASEIYKAMIAAAPQAVPAHLEEQPDGSVVDTRSEPQAVPAWLPIESAPKDGTRILICRAVDADGKPMGEKLGLFVQRAAWWEGEGWVVYCSLVRDPKCFFEPTHWMPIPAAPKGAV